MTAATQPIDWNAWRASYDDWSFEDQQAFYDQVFEEFPEQARFSTRVLGRLLACRGVDLDPFTVVELGGWDGGFAAEMLERQPRLAWTNYEISAAAVAASVCNAPRYRAVALDDCYWAAHHTADLFLASHVLEHLRLVDVRRVLDATTADWVFLQAPLGDSPSDWHGYHGSHILEVGWSGLEAELAGRGYRLLAEISEPWARCFERDGAV